MKYSSIFNKCKYFIIRIFSMLFQFIGFFPADDKLVVFESFFGKQFSCNPRSIYEYLQENHPEYKLLWSADKKYKHKFEQNNLQYVKRFSFKWFLTVPRAKYWVINTRMPQWIKKPKHTVYLQTWHGTPLKKLGTDIETVCMPGTTTNQYKKNFLEETRNWDYLISPNLYSTKIFEGAFNVESTKILETGYPRNDYLINHQPDKILQIKEKLEIPTDKKVILYAPTWRDDEYFSIGNYKFSLNMDISKLQKVFKERYVILFRLHYLISNNIDVSDFKGFIYDLSNYDDIRDLYVISDLLITDYSSVFFDYLCLKRPIIFYTYDIEKYRDKLRGFYFDFEKKAPGPLVKNTEQLIDAINKSQLKKDTAHSDNFLSYQKLICQLENGISAKRVVEKVFLERETS